MKNKEQNKEFWDNCLDKLDDKHIEESASLKTKPVFNPKFLVGATAVAACLALNIALIGLLNRSNNSLPASSGENVSEAITTTTPITDDTVTTTPPIDDTTTTTVTAPDKVDLENAQFETEYRFTYNSDGNNYYDLALTLVENGTTIADTASVVVENPFVTDGDCVMPGEAYMPSICQGQKYWNVNSGCFLLTNSVEAYRIVPVVIPGIKDGVVCNAVSLYKLTDEEIIRLNGEDIYTSNARLFMNEDNPKNIISFINLSGGVTNCVIDFEANTYNLTGVINDMGDDYVIATDEILRENEFNCSLNDGDEYSEFFGSRWANDDEILEIDLLGRADVDFCFSKSNGYFFMLKHTEGDKTLYDIYYINNNNDDIMYAYTKLSEDFGEINLYDYNEVYQRTYNETERTNTFIYDNIVEFSRGYPRSALDIKNLYNFEVTDINGNVWSRGDISAQAGWLPMIATVYSDGCFDGALLKMTNDAGEEKYISFETMTSFPEGEHYVIDMPLSVSREHENTSLYLNEKLKIEKMPVSALIENYEYFVCSDGSYYALVNFGADQAQWLECSEVFYYVNGEYKLLCDDMGLYDALVDNDLLYIVYTDPNAENPKNISLRVYQNGVIIFDGIIIDGGHVNYSILNNSAGDYVIVTHYAGTAIIKEENGRISIANIKADDIDVDFPENTFKFTYNGVGYTQDDVIPDELFVEYK